MLFNNSENGVSFEIDNKGYVVYDGEKDKYYSLKGKNERISISLSGYQSIILLVESGIKDIDGEYEAGIPKKWQADYEEKPSWVYMPKEAVAVIKNYDITVNGKKKLKFKNHKFTNIRDIYGTQDQIYKDKYLIPYFDLAPREQSIYPCEAKYYAVINYNEEYGRILFDGGTLFGEYKILWNGQEMNKDVIKERVYDVKNYSFNPKWKKGKNILEIIFNKAQEFDGVCGEIFVMKKQVKEN